MTAPIPSVTDVQRKVSDAAFGKPLITNVHRGLVVEAIVAVALEPDWRWCSEDYSSWDFEHEDGTKLEVKQSAARQSWTNAKPSACSFDIASRTGRWEHGTQWVEEPGRNADIYVFAHHPVFDDSADHRSADQWHFYVVPTLLLPATKRISLTSTSRLSQPLKFDQLGKRVGEVRISAAPSGSRHPA